MIVEIIVGLSITFAVFFVVLGIIAGFEGGEGVSAMFLCFWLVVLLMTPSFIAKVRNTTITHEVPTVIKTNNVVIVTFLNEDQDPITWTYSEVPYWNSTNILVEVEHGNNLWGRKVSPSYRVVLGKN